MLQNRATSTESALAALRADRDALIEICDGLNASDWAAPSGCEGWTTTDLVSHMASLFWAVADPSTLANPAGLEVEEIGAANVEARRSMSPDDVLADYCDVSLKALDLLVVVAGLDMDIPFSEFESYPAAAVPLAFCFDHFVHIRADLLAPRGAVTAHPPAADEERVAATLDWIEIALPVQNADAIGSLPGPVDLVVTGPGGRTLTLGGAGPDPVATVKSDALSFARWITQRGSWDELDVVAAGADPALETLRALKVY